MEGFAVAASAVAVAKRKRAAPHPPDRIERAVNLARQTGPLAAVSTMNKELGVDEKLSEEVVRQWLFKWRKQGEFWKKSTKIGRPAQITKVPGAQDEWERQLDSLRGQGQSVTARVSATVLRAVYEEKAPSLLDNHGGSTKCSVRSSQYMLAAEGKSFRKRTSSRIIPPADVLAGDRDQFYDNLRACFPDDEVDLELLLNYDQTMQLYSPNRGYTWEKKGADRVQLRMDKEGFTLLPVVSAVSMIGAQLIFSGSTKVSLPAIAPGPLLQYCQTENHWSNEDTTVDLFKKIIFPHISRRRAAIGKPTAPAIVLADAYPAHWTPKIKDLVAGQVNVAYVAIPDNLTHLFQPLDLGIIAAMKNSILRRKDEFLEAEVRVAIRENRGVVLSRSRPVLRDRMAMFVKEVVADPAICAERCCRSGFERAGVTAVLYGDGTVPDVDHLLVPASCDECGERGFPRRDSPSCVCFADDDTPTLCDGCFSNHETVCETR